MQKTLLIMAIVFVSLVCTACVNKFAVSELNNNAKNLLAEGKVDAAISRLESSIYLDDSVFETHYNLAVAYMQANKYDEALNSLAKVNELNPDFADAYHSIAVINEEEAYKIISGEEDDDKSDSENAIQPKDLSSSDKAKICDYFSNAIENYNKYLAKKENADDKDKVNAKIDDLNTELRKYSSQNIEKAE